VGSLTGGAAGGVEGAEMNDYSLNAEPGRHEVTGSPLGMIVTRSAETWQFFALMFGAMLATAFAFIDEVPAVRWRIGLKVTPGSPHQFASSA
jgi:hypothetical protein